MTPEAPVPPRPDPPYPGVLAYEVTTGEDYVGYVFTYTRGRAKQLTVRTDPGGYAEFTHCTARRRRDLDGLAPENASWWCPSDVPGYASGTPVVPLEDLWSEI